MTTTLRDLGHFLARAGQSALVEVADAKGSTPREAGAWMLVSEDQIFGTIGGGQLEYMAIDEARGMMRGVLSPLAGEMPAERAEGVVSEGTVDDRLHPDEATPPRSAMPSDPPHKGEGEEPGGFAATLPARGRDRVELDIPLGPEIGQCCGGRVQLTIRLVDETIRQCLLAEAQANDASRPHVYLFGGGHVGLALASAFALLPVRSIVVESRPEAVEGLPAGVEPRLTPVAEEVVRSAPAGSAFVVLTHDHALDFLIVAEALKRSDAAYVGMIGSKTKKATFRSWFLKTANGTPRDFNRLVSPIGGDGVDDKRPAVIASLAVAEIVTALYSKAKSRVS